jgi:succinoglycan biosynthesis transport protein ExoP
VAQAYSQRNLDSKMTASMDAVKWLRQEAEALKASLDESELALQDYKEKTLSTSVVDEQNVVMSKLQDLSHALTLAQTERLQVETEAIRIQALIASGGDLTQIDVITSDALVAGIQSDILDKQSEVEVLRMRYKEKHPSLQRPLQELDELKDKLHQACLRVASNVSAKLNMEKAKEESLRKALAAQQVETFELDRKLMQYNELQRNVQADRELYNSVLARMKSTSVSGKLEINNVRLIDEAMVPGAPFNINKMRSLIQAGVFGLVLGIGLALLLHFADDRVKRTEEIERNIGLPVLAVIPRIVRQRPSDRARVAELDRQSPSAEAFRTLRASLGLSPSAKKAQRIMVTSASPSAGKSLVSSNLATVFAHNGLKTLLIDSDLRRPSQHRAFELQRDEGLSHVLAGNISWKEAVIHTETENLDIVLVGTIPPNPAELLGSSEMTEFMDEASKKYDKIIVDAPPVFGLSDPLVLLQQVEGVVFVVHFNKSRRRNLTHAVQKLREGDTPLIGAVMNDVDLRRPSGYYYYYHQYGYYYDNQGTKKHKRKRT